MISLKKVDFSYTDSEKKVIKNMNLEIEDGTFVCIVGSSGCGKSTLLRLLSELEKPNEGNIEWSIKNNKRKISVVFQEYSLFPWMTAKKNIMFSVQKMDKINKKSAQLIAEKYLEKVGMAGDGNKYPCQLSGGMKQRVAIARAFATDSQILLMDEPFGALDISTKNQMYKILDTVWKESKNRKTVVLVTHDIEEAIKISEKVIFMRNGCIAKEYDLRKYKKNNQNIAKKEYTDLKRKIENEFYEVC